MKKLLSFILIFICISKVSAQTIIKGTVEDENNSPLSYVTVILCSQDTVRVNYAVTDLNGCYEFKVEKDKTYLLQISSVGYKTHYTTAKSGQIISLIPDILAIKEVVIKGNRPISKITSEGIQTTVSNTVLSNMGTGNDVLKHIPMVTGDKGSYDVFGRGKAIIYINSRLVRDPSEIDNLNSTDIESIEVVTSPGAKYSATVPAVINIKTKKKQGDGISLSIRSSFYTWNNQDYINQINTNYRKGGLDFFINAYYSDYTSYQKSNMQQKVNLDTLWSQNNQMVSDMRIHKLNGIMGVNYEINDHHCIGFRYDLKSSPGDDTQDLKLKSYVYADRQLYDKWENREFQRTTKKPNSQANFYYIGKIKKLSLDFNTDYLYGQTKTKTENHEVSQAFGSRIIQSINNVKNSLWASKLQLSYPIWKGELQGGCEYVNITRKDEYINNSLEGFSSTVNVDEQNTALFTQYQAATKLGNFAVGLRYEGATYDYIVDKMKDRNKSQTYRQWFPNASYSNLFGKVNLQISYHSKVTRPSYSQLSNGLLYANKLTILTGNPYLKPTNSQDISLMGVWKFIQGSVSYTHQKNAISMWIDRFDKDPKVSLITYRNIDVLRLLSAHLTIAPKFGVWKPQLNGGITKQWMNLAPYGVNEQMSHPIFFASLNNTFELPYELVISLDAAYTSKGNSYISYIYKDNFVLDWAVTKSFFKKSLQIKLAMSDVFNQKFTAYQTIAPQTVIQNLSHFDNREISLTIRYNFNSAKNKYKGNSAGQDAMNRL